MRMVLGAGKPPDMQTLANRVPLTECVSRRFFPPGFVHHGDHDPGAGPLARCGPRISRCGAKVSWSGPEVTVSAVSLLTTDRSRWSPSNHRGHAPDTNWQLFPG